MMTRFLCLCACLLCCSTVSLAQRAVPVPTTTYADAAQGVSFRYPVVWVTSDKAPMYMGPAFVADNVSPRASFSFSPAGNLYEKTLLLGLVFSYFVVPSANEHECVQQALRAVSSPVTSRTIIHGVPFSEVKGGDAGMCHEQSVQIDVTFRKDQCLAFERDFNTECYGADETKRRLTSAEQRALQHHLDEVMQSVIIQ